MVSLLVLLGCAQTAPATPVEPATPPGQHVAMLQEQLDSAHRTWSEGQRTEASDMVLAAYHDHFEPIEPALRARDALGTLSIEIAFGRLAAHLGRSGDAVTLLEETRALSQAVAAHEVPTTSDPEPVAGE